MEMKGLVAIVTGASRGIGRAIAKEYARHGAKVVVAARPDTPTGLQDTVFETAKVIQQEGGEALPVACDVAEEQQVDDMVRQATEHYGRIDVLVNNAGIFFPLTHCVEIEPDRWDQLMAVNVRGPYLTCRRVLPTMIGQRRGSIINVGSAGGIIPRSGSSDYSSSKAALHMFSLCLAEEVREYNIAVNVLDPGGVKTEWNEVIGRPPPWNERVDPVEVCPSAVHLALQSADTLTGQVLRRIDFGKAWS